MPERKRAHLLGQADRMVARGRAERTATAAKQIRALSKGNLQRFGLAQALLGDPDLLILDEPTHGLDPVWLLKFRAVMRDLRRPDRTMLIASHDLAELSALTEETLSVSGVLLAKVFGNQARDTARYHEENQRLSDLEVRQQMIGQSFYAIVQAFLSITPAAVYLVAGLLLANGGAISAGTVVAFTTLQTRLYFPVGRCCRSPWSCDRLWPCSTGSSSTSTWCPTSSTPPTPSICR